MKKRIKFKAHGLKCRVECTESGRWHGRVKIPDDHPYLEARPKGKWWAETEGFGHSGQCVEAMNVLAWTIAKRTEQLDDGGYATLLDRLARSWDNG